MKLKVFVAVIALSSTSGWAIGSTVEDSPIGAHLMISGSARVEATPDMAILTFQVSVAAKEAVAAKAQVDKRVTKYFDFLKQQGIEENAIEAANLTTEPEYNYLKNGKAELTGYRAERIVQVTLHQLDKLNRLLDAALKANLNEVRRIELGVNKPEIYREKARQKAIKSAIEQASDLAKGFGVPLGTVYSINYHVSRCSQTPAPFPRLAMVESNGASTTASETYQLQTIHFDDQVEVVFRLGQ